MIPKKLSEHAPLLGTTEYYDMIRSKVCEGLSPIKTKMSDWTD